MFLRKTGRKQTSSHILGCDQLGTSRKRILLPRSVRASIMSACFKTTVAMLLLSTTYLFHVSRWKSRRVLLEREGLKRSYSSAQPELEVVNRSRP